MKPAWVNSGYKSFKVIRNNPMNVIEIANRVMAIQDDFSLILTIRSSYRTSLVFFL